MAKNRDFWWSPERVEELRRRYETDGPAKIAEDFGTTPISVTAKARRLGLGATRKKPPPKFKWTQEMIAAIKTRYTDEAAYKLAEEFGVTLDTVRRKASRLGFHTIAGHAKAGKERAVKSTSCDIHYFDAWSPNMAYILGFLFADGNIPNTKDGLRILLAAKDVSILEFIRSELKIKSEISHLDDVINPRTGLPKPQVRLVACSSVLADSLMARGMHPGKTFRDDPFPDVPDDMMPHFVRGFLDGDGTTSVSSKDVCSVGFVGPVPFITGLREALIRLADMRPAPILTRKGVTATVCTVTWCGVEDVRKFYAFAYPEGFTFCLKRKKDNLDRWLSVDRKSNVRRPWTAEEEDQVRNLYHVIGPTKVAELLDRERTVVQLKARDLGLSYINKSSDK